MLFWFLMMAGLSTGFPSQAPLVTPAMTLMMPQSSVNLSQEALKTESIDSPSDSKSQGHSRLNDKNGIQWQPWQDDLFTRAKAENKLVILDLEAVWCHWCHVMEQETYSQPDIIREIGDHYIAVRVDQDARPDLSTRYQDYGWPATIIFAPDGTELSKNAGFIPADEFGPLLSDLRKNPIPQNTKPVLTSIITSPYLASNTRETLQGLFQKQYDSVYGAWGKGRHKFLDWDSMDYAMALAKTGNDQAKTMALKTLDGQRNLLDPAWGGMYQYSTHGDWAHPHFEKIMSVQAENLRVYAQAYAEWKRPEDLKTAQALYGFLTRFLRDPETGAFYTSMDADLIQGEHSDSYFKLSDSERVKLGIPRIDTHQYARENGWVINALCSLYEATGEKDPLNDAVVAAHWVLENRGNPNGSFRHDAIDTAGPYLGDSIAMGRALVSLYRVTGDRTWLTHAEKTANAIHETFTLGDARQGYASTPSGTLKQGTLAPSANRDENVIALRFLNQLYHVTGKPLYKQMSETAMTYLASPGVAEEPFAGSTLIADFEMTQAPLHMTIVGHKDDPASQQLFEAALRYPSIYKRVDWWDKREGSLPNPDVDYPELKKPAAFICTDKRCSLPIFEAEKLPAKVDRVLGITMPDAMPEMPLSGERAE
jgi:uncharacterized protein